MPFDPHVCDRVSGLMSINCCDETDVGKTYLRFTGNTHVPNDLSNSVGCFRARQYLLVRLLVAMKSLSVVTTEQASDIKNIRCARDVKRTTQTMCTSKILSILPELFVSDFCPSVIIRTKNPCWPTGFWSTAWPSARRVLLYVYIIPVRVRVEIIYRTVKATCAAASALQRTKMFGRFGITAV